MDFLCKEELLGLRRLVWVWLLFVLFFCLVVGGFVLCHSLYIHEKLILVLERGDVSCQHSVCLQLSLWCSPASD